MSAFVTNAGNDSIKKSNKHFGIYNDPRRRFSSKAFRTKKISIRHKRERKETDICGFEMEIKPLLVFILVPLSASLPLTLSALLPHFRMGVHGWVNGLVSCNASALKMRPFLLELAPPPSRFLNVFTCADVQTPDEPADCTFFDL